MGGQAQSARACDGRSRARLAGHAGGDHVHGSEERVAAPRNACGAWLTHRTRAAGSVPRCFGRASDFDAGPLRQVAMDARNALDLAFRREALVKTVRAELALSIAPGRKLFL